MPSNEFEIIDEIRRLKVKAENEIHLLSGPVFSLLSSIELFHSELPITSLDIIRDLTDFTKYDFIITLMDTRVWHQIFYFTGTLKVNLDLLAGIWDVGLEIEPIRTVRQILVTFIDFYKVKTVNYERF